MTPGQNGRLTFNGAAGQHVSASIALTSGGTLGPCYWYLKILKPDGTTLGSAYACGGTVLSLATQTLPSTAVYTLLIDPTGMNVAAVNATVSTVP